jgi:hypothetical protein
MSLSRIEKHTEKREYHFLHKFQKTAKKFIHAAKKNRVTFALLGALAFGGSAKAQQHSELEQPQVVQTVESDLFKTRKEIYALLHQREHAKAAQKINAEIRLLHESNKTSGDAHVTEMEQELDALLRFTHEHIAFLGRNLPEGLYVYHHEILFVGHTTTMDTSHFMMQTQQFLMNKLHEQEHAQGKTHIDPKLSLVSCERDEGGKITFVVRIKYPVIHYELNNEKGTLYLHPEKLKHL